MGLAGLVDGLSGFCFFILLTEAGIQNTSEKATINRDLWSETVDLPASEKPFCPPRLLFSVLVIWTAFEFLNGRRALSRPLRVGPLPPLVPSELP
jgi:hypothetical protein